MKNKLIVFRNRKIRRVWYSGEWFFSVVDVILALTDSQNPRNYWSMLKSRELDHNIELSTNCVQLKLESIDGKKYLTDCANKKGIFRIIQSIPSKKAEPFKLWLAKVGSERIDETEFSDEQILKNIPSLVSWWRFEGNAQDEIGGNDGELVGNVNTQGGHENLLRDISKNLNLDNRKPFKIQITDCFSNLRIVSMFPSDPTGSLDDFFSFELGVKNE
ncbi:MAG: Bro-N domain-containing protein [Nanoarchaeota archaeon]